MYELIDAHCHVGLTGSSETTLMALKLGRESGISEFITSSAKFEDWENAEKLHIQYPGIEYTVGIHPWFIPENYRSIIELLSDFTDRGAVGIGEIGLDKAKGDIPFSLQTEVFIIQLQIAIAKNMPVVIHCVKAYNELIEILKNTGVPEAGGFVHGFSSSRQIAGNLIDLGISISAGKTLLKPAGEKTADAMRLAWPEHLLIETDSPYADPTDEKNIHYPCEITDTLKILSSILKTDLHTTAQQTTVNSKRIFRLNT